MDNTEIGNRFKKYERVNKNHLPPNTYAVLRIDGKCFKNYTKGLKIFDPGFSKDMIDTMKYLFENIEGALFGITHSDEISIVFSDLKTHEQNLWFDGNISKIVSVSASLATAKFNELRRKRGFGKLAIFDSRVFSVSQRFEVLNYLYWRQYDATRNSIQSLARSLYSHKECYNKNMSQLQDMCYVKGFNWNDLEVYKKRGTACYKKGNGDIFIDLEVPIFSKKWDFFDGKILPLEPTTAPPSNTAMLSFS